MTLTQNLEEQPLLARDSSPLIKTQESAVTGWSTTSRQHRKICFLPHHLLEWMYDHVPASPIPKDAMFHRLQFDGRERYLIFDFYSQQAPEVKAVRISFDELEQMLKTILRDRVPTDVRMSSFYRSDLFAYVMVELSSTRFPNVPDDCYPVIQVRYERGKLYVSDHSQKEKPATEERV